MFLLWSDPAFFLFLAVHPYHPGMWNFPGQGSNPSCSCGHAGSLTHCASGKARDLVFDYHSLSPLSSPQCFPAGDPRIGSHCSRSSVTGVISLKTALFGKHSHPAPFLCAWNSCTWICALFSVHLFLPKHSSLKCIFFYTCFSLKSLSCNFSHGNPGIYFPLFPSVQCFIMYMNHNLFHMLLIEAQLFPVVSHNHWYCKWTRVCVCVCVAYVHMCVHICLHIRMYLCKYICRIIAQQSNHWLKEYMHFIHLWFAQNWLIWHPKKLY